MKYFFYLISILIIFSINISLNLVFDLKQLVPSLSLIFLIIFTLDRGSLDFFFVAFFTGIILDFYSHAIVGSYTLSLVLLSYSLHLLVDRIALLDINWKYLFILSAGSVIVSYILVVGFNNLMFYAHLLEPVFLYKPSANQIIKELIAAIVLVVPFYAIFDRLKAGIAYFLSKRKVVL